MSTSTLTTAAMHRSHQPRATRTPPPLHIPRPSSQSTIVPSSSPPQPTPNPRRPSISNTMHWLSRTSTQSPSPSSLKPVKVSEPKLVRALDILPPPSRSGTLGSGATIVRTPDEALRETGVRLTYDVLDKESFSRTAAEKHERHAKSPKSRPRPSSKKDEPISPPTSPPLPPLPLPGDDEEKLLEPDSPGSKAPPRPNRPPPPVPGSQTQSLRSSMKGPRAISISTFEEPPTVPPLPPHIAASTQPPPFQPIIVSEPPSMNVDTSKVIVTLETCTTTYRTTLTTINSRPSHLSNYLSSLFHFSDAESVSSSVYSTASDDMAMYRQHLTSQGLVPLSSNIHLFLDRPSAPYTHILAYLRSPVVEGQADTLPRQLQFHASSSLSPQSRLEALIEVRDEAAFLNLDSLYKLCTEEIRHRYGPRYHQRGTSSASIQSLHASIYSLHTLPEKVETDLRNSISTPLPTSDTAASLARRSKQSNPPEVVSKSPPTPQSWEGPALEQRSQSRQSQTRRSAKSPPAGWI